MCGLLIVRLFFFCIVLSQFACEEECDWKDNDRDGLIDEGFDVDRDGYWSCGQSEEQLELGLFDCDDNAAGVNPSVTEQCNERDDDCDQLIDEGCSPLYIEIDEELLDVEYFQPWETEDHGLLTWSRAQDQGDYHLQIYDLGPQRAELRFEQHFPSYFSLLELLVIPSLAPDSEFPSVIAVSVDGLYVLNYVDGVYELGPYHFVEGAGYLDYSKMALMKREVGQVTVMLSARNFEGSEGYLQSFIVTTEQVLPLNSLYATPKSAVTRALSIADVNADGLQDVVEARSNSLVLYLLGENGDVELLLQESFSTSLDGVIVAHVDGDEWLDIVMVEPERWRLWLKLGLGNGQFAPTVKIESLYKPGSISFASSDDHQQDRLFVGSWDESRMQAWSVMDDSLAASQCEFSTLDSKPESIPIYMDDVLTLLIFNRDSGHFILEQGPCLEAGWQ